MINFKAWMTGKKTVVPAEITHQTVGGDTTLVFDGSCYRTVGSAVALVKEIEAVDTYKVVLDLAVTVKGGPQSSHYHSLGSKIHDLIDSGISEFLTANSIALDTWLRDYLNSAADSLTDAATQELEGVLDTVKKELAYLRQNR